MDPWGWTQYVDDPGNPENDPLQCDTGEKSYNLFVGYEPHCYGCTFSTASTGANSIRATQFDRANFPPTDYLGGDMDQGEAAAIDSMHFVSDITIPDGTIVVPGQSLVKTWRIKNTGTTTWSSGYQLVFISGEQMGGASAVAVPVTAPENLADVHISLIAPTDTGIKTGYWQLRNPQGTYFGPKVYVKVNVATDATPSPTSKLTTFDVSPTSPSAASVVHVVGRFKAFPEFRSARFMLGNEVREMSNFRAVGDEYEISADWNTASLARGDYTLVIELASLGDNDWKRAERQIKIFTLNGIPTSTNRSPARPVLLSPYNWYLKDAAGSAAVVEMCVGTVSDPDGDAVAYFYELNGGAQISGWISNRCWSPSLSPGGYAWRVKARDSHGAESGWSTDTWNFSVSSGDVSVGEIMLYENPALPNDTHMCVPVTYGGILAPEVKAFINLASDGSENGTWKQLDHYGPNAAPDCTSPNVHGFWIRSPEYETGSHLIRVNAFKADSGASATNTYNYAISYLRPNSPRPLAPSNHDNNGTWWNTPSITFQWELALRTEGQLLRVSTSSDLWNDSAPLLDVSLDAATTTYSHTFSQDYDRLYWGVRAINRAGAADTGNALWFGIDRVTPTCSLDALTDPVYDSVFRVGWSGADNAAGVRTFEIWATDIEASFGDIWLAVPDSQTSAIYNGKPGHRYEFYCRAADNAGNVSDWQSFASTKADPASRPLEPWWDAAYGQKRSLFVLNKMIDVPLPAGYPVKFRFDSTTSPTAEELYNASLSSTKCADLRVVYNNSTELDRVMSACSSAAIEFWFRTQAAIAANASNENSYQLYYGNANAGTPASDPNQVWYPYQEDDTTNLYFFQEGAGTVAYDASGYGRHCSIDPSIQWNTSKFGHGLLFNRANAGDSRSLHCGTVPTLTGFTIEFWYLPGPDGDGRIAGALAGGGNGGGGSNWLLQSFEGRLRLDIWPCPSCGSSEVRSNVYLRDAQYVNRWNHVAVTFNGANEAKFYINGALDSTKYLSQSGINTFAPPLEIGSAEGIGQIKSSLGALRVSNSVKTSFPYGAFANIVNEPSTAAGAWISPPVAGTRDLVVLYMDAYPNPEGGILVQVVAQNQGAQNTTNGFATNLYLDHLPTGANDWEGVVYTWTNDPIEPGAIITLTTIVTELPASRGARILPSTHQPERGLSNFAPNASSAALSPCRETLGTFYAQVDATAAVPGSAPEQTIYSAGTEACVASADFYEGDDAATLANSIAVGEEQAHNFSTQGDHDWMSFAAQAGTTYIIHTSNLGIAADTSLHLYDQDGITSLASNDDDDDDSLASSVKWVAPANGTYYILVRSWNPNVSGCGTRYTLSLDLAETKTFLPFVVR
ncbi:MAG: NBR1-Ig-like domain-containing protein [Chloroflexota bacterium]